MLDIIIVILAVIGLFTVLGFVGWLTLQISFLLENIEEFKRYMNDKK